jgi:hypothetical protein
MRTKSSDPTRRSTAASTSTPPAPNIPGTIAYWLEDDLGNRISKLFASSAKPLRLAGRVLEKLGTLRDWAVARRDVEGRRHVVAASEDLEVLARPFMPDRTPEEAAVMARIHEALRKDPKFPTRARPETDGRVY